MQSFVSSGGIPTLISSAFIQELKGKNKSQENTQIATVPQRGDKLKVTDESFNGINVVFFQPNGDKRAEVLLTIMNQKVRASFYML